MAGNMSESVIVSALYNSDADFEASTEFANKSNFIKPKGLDGLNRR